MNIPYGKHDICAQDIDAVCQVLTSDHLTQGSMPIQFEAAIANYCQVQFAFAVNNATAALHLACQVLDIGVGDWVWTSSNSFVASANCVLYCQANIDFIDIDGQTYNISMDMLQQKLIQAKQSNTLPKAIIAVHFSGLPCDMKKLHELSQEYGFYIIEDAAHAIGAYYEDKPIGSCQYSDLCLFSFHPVKNMTSGEGGMLLTNQDVLAEKIELLRNHGISKDSIIATNEGAWCYQQTQLGYNYRMSDIHAALGLSQFKRLTQFIQRRQEIAHFYHANLQKLALTTPFNDNSHLQDINIQSAWHLYVIRLDLSKLSCMRKQIYDDLHQVGIKVQIHYIPIHTQPYYQSLGVIYKDLNETENYYQEALSLPIFYSMSDEQLQYVQQQLTLILTRYDSCEA